MLIYAFIIIDNIPYTYWVCYFDKRYCKRWEYTSGSPARFNSWLWSHNKHKVDASFQAARVEQNWYSKLSVHSCPDSNFCVNFSDMYIIKYTISLRAGNSSLTCLFLSSTTSKYTPRFILFYVRRPQCFTCTNIWNVLCLKSISISISIS